MRKLFLASSFSDVAKLFPQFAKEDCKGKTVTFISTASLVEKVNFYVKSAQKAFNKIGIIVDEFDITNASKEAIENKISDNDYIYISGGNTFYLLQELKKTGADKIITNQIENGKIFIGESAGSMILSKNIEYAKIMDDSTKAEELENFDSLGVVDFYPVPHHTNFPFKKAVEKIIKEYSTTLDLCPISNKQVITVVEDEVVIVSWL